MIHQVLDKCQMWLINRFPSPKSNDSSCTVRMILQQMKMLDYIVDPEQLTNKLVEVPSMHSKEYV
jgi:hypothetical protein